MNPSCHRLSLDIQDESSQVLLKVKRGDTRVRLYITLNDGGKHYSITDKCSATYSAVKPDKTVILDDCTIENNQILYEFSEQVTTNIGKVISEVNLYGSQNEKLTSAKFTILVCETVINGDEVISSSEYGALDSALTKVNTLIESFNETYTGATTPENPKAGDTWIDEYGTVKEFNGTAWVESVRLVKSGVSSGIGDGQSASHLMMWDEGKGEAVRSFYKEKDINDINALAISNYQKIDQLERTALKDIHDLKVGADYREARIRVLETDAKQADKDIVNLYALSMGTGTIAETEVEDSYLGRKTGGTLDIIDGALTRVEKIEGDTVNVDGVLYSTSFKGVKSSGKNLIDIDKLVGGALVKNADGSYTITKNGGNRFSARAYIEIPHTATIGNTVVTNSIEIIESTVSDNKIAAQFFYDKDGSGYQSVGFVEPTTSSAGNPNGFKKDVVMVQLYLSHSETDGAYIKFRNLMTRYGNANQISYDYEPYKEDTSFSLGNAVTLEGFDVYDTSNGNFVRSARDTIDIDRKKLIKKIGTYVLNGSENWWTAATASTNGRTLMQCTIDSLGANPQFGQYNTCIMADKEYKASSQAELYWSTGTADKVPNGIGINYSGGKNYIYVLSIASDNNGTPFTATEWKNYLASNPITVKYEMATPIETDIDIPDDYVARLNGVEIIDDEGRTYTDLMVANNSVPKPKITQSYYTKVGG